MNKFSSMFRQILQIFSKRGFSFALFVLLFMSEPVGWLNSSIEGRMGLWTLQRVARS